MVEIGVILGVEWREMEWGGVVELGSGVGLGGC